MSRFKKETVSLPKNKKKQEVEIISLYEQNIFVHCFDYWFWLSEANLCKTLHEDSDLTKYMMGPSHE